ncbi:MAG: hypothetical protein WAK57_04715 [Desulfobacterales bacterium]
MKDLHRKKSVILFFALIFLAITVSSPFAAPSAMEIVGDFLVVRPTSFLTMIAGACVFVVTLPFTLIGGNADEAGTKLVANPAQATFSRPLGDPDTMARWPFKYDYQGPPPR